jgi:hypothetical protein
MTETTRSRSVSPHSAARSTSTAGRLNVAAPRSGKDRLGDQRQSVIEAVSEEATVAFVRRTLCSRTVFATNLPGGEKGRSTPRPIEEVLPPLTSSNEVDLQLYAIIAVILKDFVVTWYSKITPDHVFIDEIIRIIAHCTRALEQRFREVDLEALLLDEIPSIVQTHVNGKCDHPAVHNVASMKALMAFVSLSNSPTNFLSQPAGSKPKIDISHAAPAPCSVAGST